MNQPDGTPAKPTLSETEHPRRFRDYTYIYAVLSRRSGGISVGINLNPDKVCNFDCIYCQVDRSKQPQEYFVGLPKLLEELEHCLRGLQPHGPFWNEPEFARLPAEKRRVSDIAFSGDGEPTTFKNFLEVVQHCIALKESLGFNDSKVVLITNATGLDRTEVQRGLQFMDAHRGEVWAKLEAGTPEYFALIDNTSFPFQKVLDNILECARKRAVVIQSCFMRVRGTGPGAAEIDAYIARLREIVAGGGRIKFVQIYTVARDPAYSIVSSLPNAEVDAIAQRVRAEAHLPATGYYGEVPEGRGLMDRGGKKQ